MIQCKQTKRRFTPECKPEAIEQVIDFQQIPVDVARASDSDPGSLHKRIPSIKWKYVV